LDDAKEYIQSAWSKQPDCLAHELLVASKAAFSGSLALGSSINRKKHHHLSLSCGQFGSWLIPISGLKSAWSGCNVLSTLDSL